MSWLARCSVWLLVGFGLVLTPLATAQDAKKDENKAKKETKKDDKKSSAKKDQDKKEAEKKEEKPVFIGTLAGTVKRILNSEDEGTFVYLEVTHISPQIRVIARRPLTGYSLAQRNRLSNRDYYGQIIPREVKQEYEVPISPELTKIRIPPKPEVDEKGKVVKKPQLQRDKKDPEYGLPGVKGEVTDLNRGQIIRVSLGQMKDPNDPKKMVIVTMMVELLLDPSEMPQQGGKP